ERIAALQRGALVVNVGRGGAIDQSALAAALEAGQVGGAGLDVTDPEPLPEDHPLWRAPNVIIASHSMNVFDRKDERRFELFEDNFSRLVRGEPLRNVVEHDRGY
ncbi:MAG: NAD(P)-dependent oxidoreductase, partial [Spirochaetota bacterium]